MREQTGALYVGAMRVVVKSRELTKFEGLSGNLLSFTRRVVQTVYTANTISRARGSRRAQRTRCGRLESTWGSTTHNDPSVWFQARDHPELRTNDNAFVRSFV